MGFVLFMIALGGCAGAIEMGDSLIFPLIFLLVSLIWLFWDYAKWLKENE